MSPLADSCTIHLYGDHILNHSISIDKKLVIQGYNEATISSNEKSDLTDVATKREPAFLLKKELFLTSLHVDNINLLGILQSTENKTIVIHMCQFTSSTINIEYQNMSNQTHLSIINSNFTGGRGLRISHSIVIITDSRFERNNHGYRMISHTSGKGGALLVENSLVIITRSKFEKNSANSFGGALYMEKSNVTITNSIIESNYAERRGGGIYAIKSSSVTIHSSAINSNKASSEGGGMYVAADSTVKINNTAMNSNNAPCL